MSEKPSPELKPCPLCGPAGEPDEWAWSNLKEHGPGCNKCGLTANSLDDWERLPRNTRIQNPAHLDLLRKCLEALEPFGVWANGIGKMGGMDWAKPNHPTGRLHGADWGDGHKEITQADLVKARTLAADIQAELNLAGEGL